MLTQTRRWRRPRRRRQRRRRLDGIVRRLTGLRSLRLRRDGLAGAAAAAAATAAVVGELVTPCGPSLDALTIVVHPDGPPPAGPPRPRCGPAAAAPPGPPLPLRGGARRRRPGHRAGAAGRRRRGHLGRRVARKSPALPRLAAAAADARRVGRRGRGGRAAAPTAGPHQRCGACGRTRPRRRRRSPSPPARGRRRQRCAWPPCQTLAAGALHWRWRRPRERPVGPRRRRRAAAVRRDARHAQRHGLWGYGGGGAAGGRLDRDATNAPPAVPRLVQRKRWRRRSPPRRACRPCGGWCWPTTWSASSGGLACGERPWRRRALRRWRCWRGEGRTWRVSRRAPSWRAAAGSTPATVAKGMADRQFHLLPAAEPSPLHVGRPGWCSSVQHGGRSWRANVPRC